MNNDTITRNMIPTGGRSNYRIVKEDAGLVWIVDRNDGAKSVTNDAESVTAELAAAFPFCRFFYRDSEGIWAELLHSEGVFTGFCACPTPTL